MADSPQHEYVTVGEAHRRTGLGRRQFTRAIARGQLEVFDVGWPRVRWSDVLVWIERQRRPATRQANPHE